MGDGKERMRGTGSKIEAGGDSTIYSGDSGYARAIHTCFVIIVTLSGCHLTERARLDERRKDAKI